MELAHANDLPSAVLDLLADVRALFFDKSFIPMLEKEMKQGDKVWKIGDTAWYLDRNSMEIKSAIVTDVFVYGTKRKFCLLSLNSNLQPRLSSVAAFPTREALCEHYRKIFE